MRNLLHLIAFFAFSIFLATAEEKVICEISEEKVEWSETKDVLCTFQDVELTKPGFKSNKTDESVTVLIARYQYNLEYLPDEIGSVLPNVKSILVMGTSLKAISKENFIGLNNLVQLKLANNQIATIAEGSFDDLEEVVTLSLNSNALKTLPLDIFSKMVKLELLSLSRNELTTLDKNLFKYNVELSHLELAQIKLETIDPEIFSTLTKLETIDMEYNEISHVHPDLFKSSVNLKDVILSYNNLTTIPIALFSNSPNLVTATLASNPLTVVDFLIFDKNEKIESINFKYIKTTTVLHIDVIDKLNMLKKVFIGDGKCFQRLYKNEKFANLKQDVVNCTSGENV